MTLTSRLATLRAQQHHAACNSETCEVCYPDLARINTELSDVARQMQIVGGREWDALSARYDVLLDQRWELLAVSGLYSEATP